MTVNFAPGDLVRARGREWVALPSPRDGILALRPLSGSENDMVILDPSLETQPVAAARFDLPADAVPTVQAKAALLSDAMRLTLRRGAGPFRSAAQLAFEPRTYQLVPLLMALRLQVPRLLIADDVGIGKTIEAGLIIRELMDRGEVDGFSVLCPPHLVEQWVGELKHRFGIDAVAVTSGSAARLERGLPLAQTLFDAYPYTVVSLDYIKAEKRREGFARACPDFVIVDEAHASVGTHKGKQQRFELLAGLARDPERRMIFLTATPHSGDQDAFGRLLSLIDPSFGSMNFDDARYRERLARHVVQRSRIDILADDWGEHRAFPKREEMEGGLPYRLSQAHLDFQDAVLDYCFGVVSRAGCGLRERRLAFWGTLALMRCVGSSPAAALSALRNRMSNESDRLEPQIYDEDSDDEDAVDIEPGTGFDTDPALQALVAHAEELIHKPDPKLSALIDTLTPLIKKGANPVVFCRFLATAEHVRNGLRKAFPKLVVEAVTGVLTPDERRDRVAEMAAADDEKEVQRILVATDCLSEGINLQQLFDTVIHYDLSWNPTRHQQREGRVDRFGQPAELVRSIMMFSPDSAIDGAVLDVVLRKAEEIRKATGITVPLPDERGPVTDALMAAVMLRQGISKQLAFDLRLEDGTRAMEARWRDASENERKSRARFAQNAMKPQEVAPEWEKVRTLLGSPADAKVFVERAMSRFGASLEPRKTLLVAHVHALEAGLKERLAQRDLTGSVRLAMTEPAPSGTALLTRTHPLTATLAEALVEASLDPEALSGLGIGRVGAWPTLAVQQMTRLALLRIRFKLTVHARKERLLLAEEAAQVAIQGGRIVAAGEAARELLNTPADADLAPSARDRFVAKAKDDLPALLDGPLAEFVRTRAEELMQDHARLRAAAGSASRVTVEAVLPPDVIGLFVLMPSEV
jgi:superfamily II DNA or RNA helicase